MKIIEIRDAKYQFCDFIEGFNFLSSLSFDQKMDMAASEQNIIIMHKWIILSSRLCVRQTTTSAISEDRGR